MGKTRFVAAAVAVAWVSACGGGGGGGDIASPSPPPPAPPPPSQNHAPVAEAGDDIAAHIAPGGTQLDGSQSSDPDGDTLTFLWTVKSTPDGAEAVFDNDAVSRPLLQTLVPGTYEVELTVTDPDGASGFDTVLITLENDPPEPVASVSLATPAIGEAIELSAVESSDPNGQPMTYTWTVESAPAGTQIATEYEGIVWPVSFDVKGEYLLSLSVTDGFATEQIDVPPIAVTEFSIRKLPGQFGGKAVQPGGGTIVAESDGFAMVFEEGAQEPFTIPVPPSGLSVAISPNGQLAAIGHFDEVTFLDLEARSVVATWPFESPSQGLVLSNQGDAYIFNSDSATTDIKSVNMSTGAVRTTPGRFPDTSAMMHPSNQKIYTLSGLIPNELGRYAFADGLVSDYRASPVTAGLCATGWIADDGASMLTFCGDVLRLTDNPATDMTLMGRIKDYGNGMLSASYSAYTKYWYVLGPPNDEFQSKVLVYDSETLEQVDTIVLPLEDGLSGNQLVARFVAASQTDDTIRILATDHPTADKDHYMLVTRVPAPVRPNAPPEIVLQKYSAGYAGAIVELDASASHDPEGDPLTFEWNIVEEPQPGWSTLLDATEPRARVSTLVDGDYVLEVKVSDGVNAPVTQQVRVLISSDPELAFYRIAGNVLDAEYSRSLNTLAYVVEGDPALHLVELYGFSERVVPLDQQPYRIGLSPDGEFAAVSQAGRASLIDVVKAELVDSQQHSWDWGDIVLDASQRAHTVTDRGNWGPLVTIDFKADTVSMTQNVSLGTQLRLHPTHAWIYGATTKLTPSYLRKWDATSVPVTSAGTSQTGSANDPEIGGNVWTNDDGDRLLAASGALLYSDADPALDMSVAGNLPDDVTAAWAAYRPRDHDWGVVVNSSSNASLVGKIAYFDDQTFAFKYEGNSFDMSVAGIPHALTPKRLFASPVVDRNVFLMFTDELVDGYVVRVGHYG